MTAVQLNKPYATPENGSEPFEDAWFLEDGRCQIDGCGRPMDRACACFVGRNLVCPNCRSGILEPFAGGLELGARCKAQFDANALELLAVSLDAYGVILACPPNRYVTYWLPGVGRFIVNHRRRRAVLLYARLYPKPELHAKPQARTRGLPTLSLAEVRP